ncbi:hypothetical protein [Luteolibacter sp. AS25]|uniref:hypothetical protein n=1 Tax=Luteolibacter sp. AS25 TaxID=3135776 RepID=UPI00398BAC0D
MKITKYISLVVPSLMIGAILGGLFVGRYTSGVSNNEMVSWGVDRMVHLFLLSEGKSDHVVDINMKILEDSITKTDYHSQYSGAEAEASLMASWIPKIYSNLDRKMPEHVSAWVTNHERKTQN